MPSSKADYIHIVGRSSPQKTSRRRKRTLKRHGRQRGKEPEARVRLQRTASEIEADGKSGRVARGWERGREGLFRKQLGNG